jgi:hypothetical protein
VGPKVVPPLLDHCAQHLVFFYLQKMQEMGRDIAQRTGLPPDETLAAANSELVKDGIVKDLQPLLQSLGTAMQLMQSYAPKPPQDPRAMALLEAAKMDTARKAEADKASAAQRQAEAQAKLQAQAQQQAASDRIENLRLMMEQQREADRAEREAQAKARQEEIDLLKAQLAATTEHLKNAQDNEAHTLTELLKNHEDNVTKLMLSQAAAYGQAGQTEGSPVEGDANKVGALVQQLLSSHQAKLDQLVAERARAEVASAVPEAAQTGAVLGQITSILARMQDHSDRRSQLDEAMVSGLSSVMKAVRAPRKLVYDAAGNPISSVPELEDGAESQ